MKKVEIKNEVILDHLSDISNTLDNLLIFGVFIVFALVCFGIYLFFLFDDVKNIQYTVDEINKPYETEEYCVDYYNDTGFILKKCEVYRDKLLEINKE